MVIIINHVVKKIALGRSPSAIRFTGQPEIGSGKPAGLLMCLTSAQSNAACSLEERFVILGEYIMVIFKMYNFCMHCSKIGNSLLISILNYNIADLPSISVDRNKGFIVQSIIRGF